ncbi:hypothetical protein MAR_013676, partial [Mya arenaria]
IVMTKIKMFDRKRTGVGSQTLVTPTKCKCPKAQTPSKFHNSPAQSKAKKLVQKYKKGYRKSPGKIERIKEALKQVSTGVSVRKAAKNFGLSESLLRKRTTGEVGFMARNSHVVEMRKESSLENSRAKVTSMQLDDWFSKFYKFVSDLHLLDKPDRVYNADESGFSMGSKASKVIGPTKSEYPKKSPICLWSIQKAIDKDVLWKRTGRSLTTFFGLSPAQANII